MIKGSCLCGQVAFEVEGPLPAPSVCHCSQCRKQSGHQWASSFVPEERLVLTRANGLKWFNASPNAKRGFCRTCGSFLFWKHKDEIEVSFSMGTLDQPTGMTLGRHIFVADKGDYYQITDDLEQQDQ